MGGIFPLGTSAGVFGAYTADNDREAFIPLDRNADCALRLLPVNPSSTEAKP